MATLNFEAIAAIARTVGFDGTEEHDGRTLHRVWIATCIARAESGGVTDVISQTGDYGLWQINKHYHPELFDGDNWKNPLTNGFMAKTVFDTAPGGPSFKPWVTYKNGRWKDFLDEMPDVGLGDVLDHVNPLDGLQAVASVFANIGNLFAKIFNPDLWRRIGLGLGGAVLTLIGFVLMFGGSGIADDVVGAVLPAGKAVKAVS